MIADDTVSLWTHSSEEGDVSTPLTGDAQCDVAIVGGGYTGLSTALHCAEKGLSAHVIEAQQIGHGGSGRNVGLVNTAAWLPPQKVLVHLGDTYGPRFLDQFGNAPAEVFSIIEKYQIRCNATRTGTIHAAHSPAGLKGLQGRYDEWQRLGAPVDLLSREEAAEKIGCAAFHGGLLDHRAGTVNPMGYCRGLARAAQGLGATISSGVKATRLRKEGAGWNVETDKGRIAAKNVILATNAYTDELWPGLNGTFIPIQFFQMSTAPLGEAVADILPGGQGLWDTGTIMFSLRRDHENRLIIGSMGPLLGDAHSGLSKRWAQKKLARLFPQLGRLSFETAWDGQIAMTADHLPRVSVLDNGLYTAIGYNGRGITTGTIFGRAMSELLTGMSPDDLPLPVGPVQPERVAALKARFYDTVFRVNQIAKGF